MGIPILGLLPFVTKILSKVLPGKTTAQIEQIADTVIKGDKELQEFVEKREKFILQYEGRAEFLSRIVGVLRAIPRLFISVGIATILFKYLWFNIPVPDKLWYLAGGVFGFYFWFRHKEKMNNRA